MDIRSIIKGELPPVVKKARVRQYHREYWHAHPEHHEADKVRKATRYATDHEYREKRKAAERERRASMSAEQKAADNQRRKLKVAAMSEAEYQAHLAKQRERTQRWRAKKKASLDG